MESDVECRDTFRHRFFLGVFPADSETVRHIWVHRYLSHFWRTDDAVRLDLLQVRVFEFLHTVLEDPREDAPRRDEFFRHSIIGRTPAIQIRVGRCFHHRFTSLSSSLFYHTLGRWRYEDATIPILSFRAKARNLFRSRSGKGCEDSGERETPCFPRIGRTVFHADSITKENGNGKRKRSLGCARDDETRKRLFPFLFNLLRKPTPPRCARQPLPREGARVDTPSFLWKEVPRRGGGWMGMPLSHAVIPDP